MKTMTTFLIFLLLLSQPSYGLEMHQCYNKLMEESASFWGHTAERLCRENIKLALCTLETVEHPEDFSVIKSERLCRKGIAKRVLAILEKTTLKIDAERLVEEDFKLALCTVNTANHIEQIDVVTAERVCRKKITKCFLETLEGDISISKRKAEEDCSRSYSNSINSPVPEIIYADESGEPISY